jgi:hypothetical protein
VDAVEVLESEVEVIARSVSEEVFGDSVVLAVDHLAEGGYNHVWLVSCELVSGRHHLRW